MVSRDSVWDMQPNQAMALQLARREIPALVYNAVNLEGVAMTLPEVQTLLDGITVGGHRIADQNMALHQAATWRHLFAMLNANRFVFSKAVALELHAIAGREEALKWGTFRTGNVSISGSDYMPPPADTLDNVWQCTVHEVDAIQDVYDQAITAFLRMARAQFFWDVNKRMGRFMMNGILLAEGFPIINVPAKRQQTFNHLMLAFYISGDGGDMNQFLRSCLHQHIIQNFQ